MSSRATFADLLELAGYVPEIEPGRRTIEVLEVTASGERLRARVRDETGAESWLPLGAGGTLTRRLRVLLGSVEGLDGIDAVRAALVGRHFRVRVEQAEYNGTLYLEIRRA